jgi:hypothetical protein
MKEAESGLQAIAAANVMVCKDYEEVAGSIE